MPVLTDPRPVSEFVQTEGCLRRIDVRSSSAVPANTVLMASIEELRSSDHSANTAWQERVLDWEITVHRLRAPGPSLPRALLMPLDVHAVSSVEQREAWRHA